MKSYQFKTNIQCGACLSKVTPFLNEEKQIDQWGVDLTHVDRILTVQSEQITSETIQSLVAKAGYTATKI
jgi:copper chaperone